MDGKDAAPTPVYRPSAEITPVEYDYYMRRAQEMRAASAAKFISAVFRAIKRLFAPRASASAARPAAERQRRAPVLVKSRTA